MQTRERNRKRAFTLIELLVVILILAILAALIVPRVVNRAGDAKIAKAASDIASLGNMLQTFRLDTDRYPTNEEGLQALMERPADVEIWNGPYSTKPIPVDPWGNPYQYVFPGPYNEDSCLVFSFGADGLEGGEGADADIF